MSAHTDLAANNGLAISTKKLNLWYDRFQALFDVVLYNRESLIYTV